MLYAHQLITTTNNLISTLSGNELVGQGRGEPTIKEKESIT
ncbi:MAG: hypothetical protein ACI8RD_011777 [Bacillariaceae sp.]|jgi:hypothetical protein